MVAFSLSLCRSIYADVVRQIEDFIRASERLLYFYAASPLLDFLRQQQKESIKSVLFAIDTDILQLLSIYFARRSTLNDGIIRDDKVCRSRTANPLERASIYTHPRTNVHSIYIYSAAA